MDPRMVALWFMALCVPPCTAPPASTSPAVTARSPVSVARGHATTLPCWLSQQQSAEDLEVRWYRTGGFDTPVLHYQSKALKVPQEASYFGRVSFGLKDAASGGLKTGDVSLKLLNVTTEDAGEYICYVSSSQGYDSATVKLLVTETGGQPFLSAVWTEDKGVNVSCESEGWYPQPVLRWSDKNQDLTPGGLLYRNVSSGLISVHSWCLLPPSSELSCSVGLPGKEAKEAKVHLEPARIGSGSSSESSVGGWVAFALLLVATLVAAAVGALYYKKKVKKHQSDQIDGKNYKSVNPEENEKLLNEEVGRLSEASGHHVNVTLEDTHNPYLTVKSKRVRDANVYDVPDGRFPDGDMVTCLTAIKGTPGFSSGKHYWEVSLGKNQTGIKQSWWVGVTSAAKIPANSNVSPNTSNGFWFLSSSPKRADSFQFSTEPKILIPVRSRPQTVGVYLDRDSGEISFYNVEDKRLIGSFTATFNGDIFPLFNPGKGDKSPMEIIQREANCTD
ncbi:butyrophilin subfamily 2 member A2-like isoform X2 [Archocentrus centrarchus]|uniref:butyrophilin subfamily 2 member A2-like isoform X2 n=1 Tax=Archocentrus centrarchus TaxID=63155 RepID=UPI0011EA4B11|nr:butyrophilin subfamily 2 member A2-like isoform X2 [Archocentrus centrarchus]